MKFDSFARKLYSEERYRFAFSLALTLVLFKLVSLFCPRMFFINDDENIMYTLSGYYTYGMPYDHYFVNFCLSYVLRWFYKLFPAIQWYGVFHVAVLIASVTLIFKTVLRYCHRRGVPFPAAVFLLLALYAAVYVFPATIMQFTTTSAFAGAAATVVLLGINWNTDSKPQVIFDGALSVAMLLLCYMHRKNTGVIVFCFFFGTALYHFAKLFFCGKHPLPEGQRKGLIRLGATMLVCVALLGAVIVTNSLHRNSDEWDVFLEFEDARFRVTDYPHDSYKENPELYQSIGWSPELYELAATSWWFLMDPRVNPESFRAIAQTGYYDEQSHSMQAAADVARELWQTSEIARIAVAACGLGVLVMLGIFLACTKRRFLRSVWEYLYGACILLGTLGLCGYLCYIQRLPLRAFHAIILPFISVWAVLLLMVLPARKKQGWHPAATTVVCLALAAAIGVGGTLNLREAMTLSRNKQAQTEHTLKVEQYAIDHPDQLFVYDVSLTFRYLPFTVYVDKYPSNLMFWGGMGYKSIAFNYQLAANGLDSPYSDVLLRDNVYYITRDSYIPSREPIRDKMERYMDATYGDCDFVLLEDHEDDFSVYKIVRAAE